MSTNRIWIGLDKSNGTALWRSDGSLVTYFNWLPTYVSPLALQYLHTLCLSFYFSVTLNDRLSSYHSCELEIVSVIDIHSYPMEECHTDLTSI